MTPYYEQDGITIYHGDCREILPSLPKVDLVLTDPPYGIDHPTDYRRRGRGKLSQCRDYPAVRGDSDPFDPAHLLAYPRAIVWGATYFSDRLPTSSGWLVWDKMRPPTLDQATVELAWTNCVKGARIYRHLWNGMIRDSERGTGYHPTQKPTSLMQWCMRWAGGDGIVLDPYMGAGPVLVAAKDMQRPAIGIEIEEEYCEIAARRVGQRVMEFSSGSF